MIEAIRPGIRPAVFRLAKIYLGVSGDARVRTYIVAVITSLPSRRGRQRHHYGHHHQHTYSCIRRCCLRRPRRRYRQHIPVITITLPRRLSQNSVFIILRKYTPYAATSLSPR